MADEFVLVPVADPMIGTVIGSFVIVRLLGRGGMGAVYLAQHVSNAHIRRVFKTMLAHLSSNPMMIQRFNIETDAVARLSEDEKQQHENIVQLQDFGVLKNHGLMTGTMYMQFEYIDGIPLDRFVAQYGGRLSLHRALYLAFQVCDALDHCHAHCVIHRDLKPDNLLVVIQGDKRVRRLLKVVDFGISKVARPGDARTISGMKMGSPYYMAVEQYANAAEATEKADVFSLAVILWLMITGELPWGRPDEPGVLYHLQQTVVPSPPLEHVMPTAVAAILLRCFAVAPDRRPTMRQLALDLAAVVAATDDAPSGGAILMHIAPRFLTSSPGTARTLPRSAMANPDYVGEQLWPSVETIEAATVPAHTLASPGALASAPVAAPESPPSTPDAALTANAHPHAFGAPAPAGQSSPYAAPLPSPIAAVAAPGAAMSAASGSGPAASSPSASPLAEAAAQAARDRSWPNIANIPTGLISQRHLAPSLPTDVLASAPRVRSVVASAEIELADGTPGPEPYAHAAVPLVVVSNTELSRVGPPSTPSLEPAPVLWLPELARSASRRKLLRILVAAAGVALVAIASFALVRWMGASPVAMRSAGAGSGTTSNTGSTASGSIAVAVVDAGAVTAAPGATTATETSTTMDAGQFAAAAMDAAAAPVAASNAQHVEAPKEHASIASSPVQPSTRASGQAASDDVEKLPMAVMSSRTLSITPSKLADVPSAARSQNDTTSAEVTLIIRVRGFAAVSIDGDEPSASPRRKRVKVGLHHVVMSGYLDGANEKQTKEFDVTVPAGREELIIHRTW